ncbi:hypothetical protein [Larsenimonas suaedae]|uniref:Uncharacterized protein n=1 Tax=Larsenimonas suaedae TaxID=1851019 RepID=A0ABU1GYY8_9GAMM|nr:hypothetical protein [Larsenimonas suaedae]MCM2973739.1 hypothetical protein [Larsenimonas suaedae]MDR5897262.1 hypothetical protein [Larsenimonas suaedae]
MSLNNAHVHDHFQAHADEAEMNLHISHAAYEELAWQEQVNEQQYLASLNQTLNQTPSTDQT